MLPKMVKEVLSENAEVAALVLTRAVPSYMGIMGLPNNKEHGWLIECFIGVMNPIVSFQ